MKLKKLLALALAGVMAVSMLAGCKSGKPAEDPTEEPIGAENAATVLNNEWDSDDDHVAVNFTYSSSVESALNKIISVNGNDYTGEGDNQDAIADLAYVLDVTPVSAWANFNGYSNSGSAVKPADTDKDTAVIVLRYAGVSAAKAMENAAAKYLTYVENTLYDEFEDTDKAGPRIVCVYTKKPSRCAARGRFAYGRQAAQSGKFTTVISARACSAVRRMCSIFSMVAAERTVSPHCTHRRQGTFLITTMQLASCTVWVVVSGFISPLQKKQLILIPPFCVLYRSGPSVPDRASRPL